MNEIIESCEWKDKAVHLVDIQGSPIIIVQPTNLLEALDLYQMCVEKALEDGNK